MSAEEYNTKYSKILDYFSQLRLFRANNVRWGMKGDTYFNDSLRLFLYLRTLNRYSPGINLTDTELNILFKNSITMVSGYQFLKIAGSLNRVQAIDSCGCKCGQTVVNIIGSITISTFNEGSIPFTTTDISPNLVIPYTLKGMYGNTPRLDIFFSGSDFIGNYQTPPHLEYQDNDSTKDLLSITFYFPIGVSGYVQISGKPS